MAEPIIRSLRVRCSPAHAFETFTGKIDLWWPPGHRRFEKSKLHLEPVLGGRFFERSATGEIALLGEVIACTPPTRISYTWMPGKITGPTLVTIEFRADGAETVLEVHHSEGEAAMGDAWPERAALFRRGWDTVLPAFAAFLATAP